MACLTDYPLLRLSLVICENTFPFDYCHRINRWFEDVEKPITEEKGKLMCKNTVYDYFKQNIWITTSGHFSTATLKYVVDEIGPDGVLFSIDYPYDTIESGCGWWDNGTKAIQEAVGGVEAYRCIGRDNAKKQLNLGDFNDS